MPLQGNTTFTCTSLPFEKNVNHIPTTNFQGKLFKMKYSWKHANVSWSYFTIYFQINLEKHILIIVAI